MVTDLPFFGGCKMDKMDTGRWGCPALQCRQRRAPNNEHKTLVAFVSLVV